MLLSICQQIWKIQQWPQDWKRSAFIPIPKKSNAKECSNYHTIAPILHASKAMLKILQARLQQYVNWELADIQAGFWKGRDQIATIRGSQRKQGDSRKKTSTVSLTTLKPLTVWIIANCGKFLKGWECHTISPGSWETCMWVERQQLEPNMEQWTCSKLGKETTRLYIVTMLI